MQPLLALAAADDLADLRQQHVHGRDRAAIVIAPHVERFDFSRIVGHHHRTFKDLLSQKTLVLGLHVHTPARRELKGSSRCFKQAHRLGVGHAAERRVGQTLQARQHPGQHAPVKEAQVVRAVAQHGLKEIAQKRLGQFGIIVQIRERHLRLDHPELRQMPPRVGVLGAEGRTEGVDIAHRAGVRLAFELAAHGQRGAPAKEIPLVIDRAIRAPRRRVRIERRHLKHRARPLAVARGDDRRVHIEKAPLVKETVRRVRQQMPHARHGPEAVRARAQMRQLTQPVEPDLLFAERILHRRRKPQDAHGVRPDLDRLPRAFGGFQRTVHRHGRAGMQPEHIIRIVIQRRRRDHLQVGQAGTVVDFKEGEAPLRVAAGTHPTRHRHAGAGFGTPQHRFNSCTLHNG